MESIIAARNVVVGDGPRRVRPAVVHVDGSTIVEVEPLELGAYEARLASEPEAFDLGERLLAPAFINAHTHVVLGFLRGVAARVAAEGNLVEDLFFRLESRLTAADAAAFARLGAYECLLGGQAVVWDHYYHAEAVADAIAEVGLSVVMAPALQDRGGPGRDRWADALDATERLAARDGARGVWAAVGPHATDTVSAGLWRRAVELAARHDLPVHAHVAQSVDEVRRIHDAHGASPLAWLAGLGVLEGRPALLVHGLYASGADIRRLDPKRHVLGYCPYSQHVFGFEARVDAWLQAGFQVAVGTDAAASNDSMNVQKELRALGAIGTRGTPFSPAFGEFFAWGTCADAEAVDEQRRRSLAQASAFSGADRVLDAVWSTPGSLHPGFRAGVIAPGAAAHLAAWDLRHPCFWPRRDPLATLAFGDTLGALDGLWVGGRPVAEPGSAFAARVLDSDAYRSALTEADERWRRLLDAA